MVGVKNKIFWLLLVLILGFLIGYSAFLIDEKMNNNVIGYSNDIEKEVNYGLGTPLYKYVYEEKILNGAIPEIEDGMLPIYYQDGAWYKADLYQKWYSYENFNWANVAIVKGDKKSYYENALPGTQIKSQDVQAYFVWIPRFEYKLFNVDFKPTYEQMINVNFVNKDMERKTKIANGLYYTHPAFTVNNGNGIEEINGFWIAKFEPSLNNKGLIEILPNRDTLVNLNMASMWNYATNVSSSYGLDIPSRIITNMEYGAIAYLSYSNYGKRNNSEYSGNNRLIFLNTAMGTRDSWNWVVTGCSAGTPVINGSYRCPYTYDFPYYGTGASSTGTIYGIYDLAGGSWECVMGIVSNYPIKNNLGGFNGVLPDNKRYYTFYQGSSDMFNYSRSIVGDAMGEVLSNKIVHKTWNGNNAFFATNNFPWIKRGGSFRGSSFSGIFDYGITDANPRGDKTFRVILSKY